MHKKIDGLRIISLFIVIGGVSYFHLNIFAPRLLPDIMKMAIMERPMNILVLGTDIDYDPATGRKLFDIGRSDTIMLVHYNPLGGKVNVLSIPRDSYVEIPGYYATKINAAYVFGKIELTKATVERLTGVRVDKYLIVNTKGLIKVVDLLGGVPVDVDKDLYYTDRAGKLFINIKQGRQNLNGKEAEGFIRFRHDASGDIGRISRQQNFLKAIAKRLSSPDALLKSPFIIGIIQKNVQTDLTIKEFILLANTFRQIDLKEINAATIPGETADNQAGAVWLIDQGEMRKIISQYF